MAWVSYARDCSFVSVRRGEMKKAQLATVRLAPLADASVTRRMRTRPVSLSGS
jgi:hypothetical protein